MPAFDVGALVLRHIDTWTFRAVVLGVQREGSGAIVSLSLQYLDDGRREEEVELHEISADNQFPQDTNLRPPVVDASALGAADAAPHDTAVLRASPVLIAQGIDMDVEPAPLLLADPPPLRDDLPRVRHSEATTASTDSVTTDGDVGAAKRDAAGGAALAQLSSTIAAEVTTCAVGGLAGAGRPAAAGPCAVCGAETPFRCSVCRMVFYCSRAHQRGHWGAHARVCLAVPPGSGGAVAEKAGPKGAELAEEMDILDIGAVRPSAPPRDADCGAVISDEDAMELRALALDLGEGDALEAPGPRPSARAAGATLSDVAGARGELPQSAGHVTPESATQEEEEVAVVEEDAVSTTAVGWNLDAIDEDSDIAAPEDAGPRKRHQATGDTVEEAANQLMAVNADYLRQLMELGFAEEQARGALQMHPDLEMAANYLFS